MNRILNIENGYFVFTIFSSLRCDLNCKHCYLSKYDRMNSPSLDLERDFREVCTKILNYYNKKDLKKIDIICYWYGGEPTVLGPKYFYKAKSITEQVFQNTNINIKHQILSNLVSDNVSKWIPLYKSMCDSYVQSSYDYLMRGTNYLEKWKKNIKKIKEAGINISAINVINNTMIGKEREIYNELVSLNIDEIGFLPFMKNTTNMAEFGENYIENSATMNEYSEFIIEFTKIAFEKLDFNKENLGLEISIGTLSHIFFNYFNKSNNEETNIINNIAGQTMFLLPKGDFVLPDYKNNYFKEKQYIQKFSSEQPDFRNNCIDNGVEYLKKFENVLSNDFEAVLNSPERQKYLKKQMERDNQQECLNCEYSQECLMEFWKTTNLDNSGECPGAKKYILFLIKFYNNLSQKEKIQFKNYFMKTKLT